MQGSSKHFTEDDYLNHVYDSDLCYKAYLASVRGKWARNDFFKLDPVSEAYASYMIV